VVLADTRPTPSPQPAAEARVLITVLNWNRPDETIACLESVFAQDNGAAVSVLLIDNGSESQVVERIRNWADQRGLGPTVISLGDPMPDPPPGGHLTILTTGRNLGYAGGNNVAFRRAMDWDIDWVLVLNNDAYLPSDFLRRLTATADRWPRAGLIGSRVMPSTASSASSYEGGRLLYAFGVYALWRWRGRRGDVLVNFVPGCAVLARTAMLAEIGLFDERFFLYTEDVDLSYRAMQAGWQLIVNLDAFVQHDLSVSMGGRRTPLYYYYVTRNTLFFISDRLSGIARISSFIFFLGQTGVRLSLWVLTGRWGHARAVTRGIRDFALKRSGQAA
jgi:GT2 family glycosyltransferase